MSVCLLQYLAALPYFSTPANNVGFAFSFTVLSETPKLNPLSKMQSVYDIRGTLSLWNQEYEKGRRKRKWEVVSEWRRSELDILEWKVDFWSGASAFLFCFRRFGWAVALYSQTGSFWGWFPHKESSLTSSSWIRTIAWHAVFVILKKWVYHLSYWVLSAAFGTWVLSQSNLFIILYFDCIYLLPLEHKCAAEQLLSLCNSLHLYFHKEIFAAQGIKILCSCHAFK